ncbi:hypothetical protein AWZ03_009549 [Drosophila navojoa]|uniref:Uncharacterized protein n=1 Tax=Drosophila navojoa TaxID=7232 RepID=A0A484B7G0_DRONA|nr:uncharacterized protein LOC108650245 [Drosophila navojoa]TDG44000.1 hypothetical protein AWZ03_009549 [Drosophila navojoa]
MAFISMGVFNTLSVLSALLLCSAHDAVHPNDTAEALKLSSLLEATRASTTTEKAQRSTTEKPHSSSTAKTKIYLATSEEDHDSNFHSNRLPALTEDETNGLSHDANPLHFLKQLAGPETETSAAQVELSRPHEEPSKPQLGTNKAQSTKSESLAGSPIYITIPIYINTSGQRPLSLLIGDQELPLQRRTADHKKISSTKSPNSYFNRLLEQVEPPKKRTTNRHRSQSRSKIQALMDSDLKGQ